MVQTAAEMGWRCPHLSQWWGSIHSRSSESWVTSVNVTESSGVVFDSGRHAGAVGVSILKTLLDDFVVGFDSFGSFVTKYKIMTHENIIKNKP